jgi:hypothetical protein
MIALTVKMISLTSERTADRVSPVTPERKSGLRADLVALSRRSVRPSIWGVRVVTT